MPRLSECLDGFVEKLGTEHISFVVGKHKQEVSVHKKLLASNTTLFETLCKTSPEKSHSGTINLEYIPVHLFGCLTSFLYSGDYPEPKAEAYSGKIPPSGMDVARCKNSGQQANPRSPKSNPEIARGDLSGRPGADVDIEGGSTLGGETIEFLTQPSYPIGSSENQSSLSTRSNPPDDVPYSLGLFSSRLRDVKRASRKRKRDGYGALFEKAYIDSCNVKEQAIKLFMDMWPRVYYFNDRIWQPVFVGDPTTCSRRAALLCHIHLYIMAGSYGIRGLLEMALSRLKTTLQVYEVCAERLSDLVDLIPPLYAGTKAPDPGRAILSAYFGIIFKDICGHPAFDQARRGFPEFDNDFLMAMKRQVPPPHVGREVWTTTVPLSLPGDFDIVAALEAS
ncbi:hypothetical protein CEP54_015455 [Fusarium duplospermum]|uniref:BTB domain-containing protein n=1 Tax=Fusarium duplospermum TaxID=1325734 RepID=A0A428NP01_9HYPO|nr:hypothetical protein CEP54_015455 [Fusarium duplospermum]